ncbi:MAG: hypothetical protein DRJ03_02860 [Chloroflexi bacterium]|nr:MAG: hypothetical protein DRJ03_02860 [Chloroflexota bacterium]
MEIMTKEGKMNARVAMNRYGTKETLNNLLSNSSVDDFSIIAVAEDIFNFGQTCIMCRKLAADAWTLADALPSEKLLKKALNHATHHEILNTLFAAKNIAEASGEQVKDLYERAVLYVTEAVLEHETARLTYDNR